MFSGFDFDNRIIINKFVWVRFFLPRLTSNFFFITDLEIKGACHYFWTIIKKVCDLKVKGQFLCVLGLDLFPPNNYILCWVLHIFVLYGEKIMLDVQQCHCIKLGKNNTSAIIVTTCNLTRSMPAIKTFYHISLLHHLI